MNNIKNKLVSKQIIEKIINRYTTANKQQVKVNNLKLYQTPFIQKSFCIVEEGNCDSDNFSNIVINSYDISNNERLEFLGDKIIDFIITEYLFDNYPNENEGFLTKLKSRMVRKESLAKLGEKLGFKEYMLINSHVERNNGRNNPRFLEDIFESFVGGFYKDQSSNIDAVRTFVLGTFQEFVVMEDLININDNFKDSALRYFHSKNYGHPVYVPLYSNASLGSKEFTCVVAVPKELFLDPITPQLRQHQESIINTVRNESEEAYPKLVEMLGPNLIVGIGKGETKKFSEQACSKDCLINLKVSLNY